MIIDAHHHLWDPARRDYPWMAAEALAPIRRTFGPSDLAAELRHHRVDATVVVQAVSSLDETEELLATAAMSPFIAGVVGWVDLTAADVAASLSRLRSRPGGELLVGLRHQVHDEADADWLLDPRVSRGLATVAEAGLVYDLLVRDRELPAARRAAAALPQLRFVLDHAAKPPISSGGWEPWAERLAALAALPNVSCKLSGLVTEADWQTWNTKQLRPYAAWVVDRFGPERLLFGSDWPVCLLAAGYGQVLGVVDDLTAGLDTEARAAVFAENARRIYRLPPLRLTPAA